MVSTYRCKRYGSERGWIILPRLSTQVVVVKPGFDPDFLMPRLDPPVACTFAPSSQILRLGGHLCPSSPEAHAQLKMVDLHAWVGARVRICACTEGKELTCLLFCHLPPLKVFIFSGPPTFERNCCFPDFQRGQKSVVLDTKQETQSPFRSFELAGRAGPGTITCL